MSDDSDREPDTDADVEGDENVDVDVDVDPFEDIEAGDAEALEDPFTEMDVEEIDEEDVWEEITSEAEAEAAGEADVDLEEETAAGASAVAEENEAIVEKSSYCQQCEFFSDPPGAACTNPGTEIVELVDTERFRVRDCPIVRQRRGTTEEVLED